MLAVDRRGPNSVLKYDSELIWTLKIFHFYFSTQLFEPIYIQTYLFQSDDDAKFISMIFLSFRENEPLTSVGSTRGQGIFRVVVLVDFVVAAAFI